MHTSRVGIVGCGHRGRAFCSAIAAMKNTDLSLCVDLDIDIATTCANDFGTTAATSWEKQSLDALVITSPIESHADAALSAIRAGIPALLEPPIALGVAEARRLMRLTHESNTILHMAFPWRYEPLVALAHRIVPAPVFGHLYVASSRDAIDPQSLESATPNRALWQNPHHGLDLATYLFNDSPAEIIADGVASKNSVFEHPNSLAADLLFSNGRHFALTATTTKHNNELGSVTLDISDGNTRVSLWSDWTRAEIRFLDGYKRALNSAEGITFQHEGDAIIANSNPTTRPLEKMVEALISAETQNHLPAPANVEDGLRATVLTQAILHAATSGQRHIL
jgi:predicted dehydrogenase